MGYMKNHSIIVSCWNKETVDRAYTEAIDTFGENLVTPILVSPVNAIYTFFVGPDGSKTGIEKLFKRITGSKEMI